MKHLAEFVQVFSPKQLPQTDGGELITLVSPCDIPPYGVLSGLASKQIIANTASLIPLQQADILIHRATLKIALVEDLFPHYFADSNTFVLRAKGEVFAATSCIADFLYTFLRSTRGQRELSSLSLGATVKLIHKSNLEKLQIPIDEFDFAGVSNSRKVEKDILDRLCRIRSQFDIGFTLCSFCQKETATEHVKRWDTWLQKFWTEPTCAKCAPSNQETWFT